MWRAVAVARGGNVDDVKASVDVRLPDAPNSMATTAAITTKHPPVDDESADFLDVLRGFLSLGGLNTLKPFVG